MLLKQYQPSDRQKLMHQLFLRMQAIYGASWSSRFGSEAMLKVGEAEWAHDLGQFEFEAIETAIDRAKAKHKDFPPTLPQFVELCGPAREPSYYQKFEALPRPKANQKIADNVLAEIRQILRSPSRA